MDLTDPKKFSEVFPHLAPRGREAALLLRRVGQKVRFKNGGNEPSDGTIHRETFEIVGVQRNYRGELCFRVRCLAYDDQFGCVLPLERALFEEQF